MANKRKTRTPPISDNLVNKKWLVERLEKMKCDKPFEASELPSTLSQEQIDGMNIMADIVDDRIDQLIKELTP